MKYRVIAEYVDLESGRRQHPGDVVDVNEERAETLQQKGLIGQAPISGDPEVASVSPVPDNPKGPGAGGKDELKHVGGGFYELPDGRRIKGKEAALAALAEG